MCLERECYVPFAVKLIKLLLSHLTFTDEEFASSLKRDLNQRASCPHATKAI